jgi:hypothetical protein
MYTVSCMKHFFLLQIMYMMKLISELMSHSFYIDLNLCKWTYAQISLISAILSFVECFL